MTVSPDPALPTAVNRLSHSLRHEVLPVLGRLPAYGHLIYRLATDAGLPAREKSALFLALGYQLSPVDLIPGFIPVVGQLDDILVMLWGIRNTLDKLPPERVEDLLHDVRLSTEQIAADTEIIRTALRELLSRGARSAGRGLMALLRAGVSAGAYLGYFAYYLFQPRRPR